MEMMEFDSFVESEAVPFMREHGLVQLVIKDGRGNKASINRDKYGFYKVTFSREKSLEI